MHSEIRKCILPISILCNFLYEGVHRISKLCGLTVKQLLTWVVSKMSPKTNSERDVVSLFSGCGGLDLGFHQQGFRTVYAADSDQKAVSLYNSNLGSEAELRNLTEGLSEGTKHLRPKVVVAGPPCQGFSTAGKRNPDDPRSHLLPQAGRLALQCHPEVIVIENVPGVRVGQPAMHWESLNEILRNARYQTKTILCDGRDLGLAQSRRRVLLFAWRTGRSFPSQGAPLEWGRLDEVLSGVENAPDHKPRSLEEGSKHHRIASRIGAGQKLCNVRGGVRSVHTWHLPEVFGETTAEDCHILECLMRLRRKERIRDFGDADPVQVKRLVEECGRHSASRIKRLLKSGYIRYKGDGVDLTHTFNGKYRRLRWEEPSCTVDTRFGDPTLFLHPNENRPFSIREAARIQGFPDDFRVSQDDRNHFRLIGNAVPPMMGQFAAKIADKLAS